MYINIQLTAQITKCESEVSYNKLVSTNHTKVKLPPTQSLVSYFKSLTGNLTVTLASLECNVAKTTSIFVPASTKVNTAIKPVLDEKPSWENEKTVTLPKV